LTNETVDVQLIENKNKYARGKLLTINKASEYRVTPQCSHVTLCGGCDLQHLDYNQQLNFKQSKVISLFSRSGMTTDVIDQLPWQSPITDLPWHYRRKARIGVQFDKNAKATIGFRQKATNQLVAIKSCPVLVKPADNIFPVLKELIGKLSVKKSIGHIEVICTEFAPANISNVDCSDQQSSKLTLVVRQVREINKHDSQLWREYGDKNQWHVFFQKDGNNEEKAKGDACNNTADDLSYRLVDDININFSTSDFIQVNQSVNLAMVEQALSWLMPEPKDQILDLFCGLGNFSLPLAKKAANVIGVEGVQSMVDKATANARFNHIDNCHFFQADLTSDWLANNPNKWKKHTFNKVLLDPARAGAEVAVKQIEKLAIETVLYVSCEPTTLARDCQFLLSKGYKIEKISLVDMFSQTNHVETMVLFKRSKTRDN